MASPPTFEVGTQYHIDDKFMIDDVARASPELPTQISIHPQEEPMRERLLAAVNRASSEREEILNSFIRSQPWRTEQAELTPFDPLEFSFAFAPPEDWLLYYGKGMVGKTSTLAEAWRLFVLFNFIDALLMQVSSWEGELHRDHLYHQFRVAWLCEKLFEGLMSKELWDRLDSIVIDSLSAEAEEIIRRSATARGYSGKIALRRLNGRSLRQCVDKVDKYDLKCLEWRQDHRHPAFAAGLFHDIGISIRAFPRFISHLLSPIVTRQQLELSTSEDVRALLLFLAHDETMGYWRALYPDYVKKLGVRQWIKNQLLDKNMFNSVKPSHILRFEEFLADHSIFEEYRPEVSTELGSKTRCFQVLDSFVSPFRHHILAGGPASIDRKLLKKLETAVDNRDHGLLSALTVADYLLPSSTRAIAFHNDDSIDIWFAKFPVAFLLVLADELQEWQRPWMRNDGRYTYALDAVDLQLSYDNDTGLSLVHPSSLVVKMDYSSRAQQLEGTSFDFFKLYRSKCKNLGRLLSLRHGDRPFPQLRITMISPEGEEFIISTCSSCGRQAPSHEIVREEGGFSARPRAECPYCSGKPLNGYALQTFELGKENKFRVAQVQGPLGKQFARVLSDRIVEELSNQTISSVAVISNGDHPHIVVITNSDSQTVPLNITELIMHTAGVVALYFGSEHQIVPTVLGLSDIQYYSDFHLRSPSEKGSFVALIEVHTRRGAITTLRAFCRHSEPDVLHDDGSFERLLQVARGYL